MKDKPVVKWDGEPIPVEQWGKDHWSTFAYAETRVVDHDGFLDMRHMRMEAERYPTFGKSFNVKGHTDLDCLMDAQAMGFLTCKRATRRGAGHKIMALTYHVEFTDLGNEVAGRLRTHKANGHNFAEFEMPEDLA